MTDPVVTPVDRGEVERREQIARTIYERFPISDEAGPWSWERVNDLHEGNYSRAKRCWETAGVILALAQPVSSDEVTGLREALAFYAAPASWGIYRAVGDQLFTRAGEDRGKRARAALSQVSSPAAAGEGRAG